MSDAIKVISESTNPLGEHYIAIDEVSGEILAGRSADSCLRYKSADEARADYYHLAINGDHGAWNICYMLQDD